MARHARSTPRIWLITGCSQGFGRIFVEEISSRGDKVIATARNKSAIVDLERLEGVKTMQLDVTSSQEELNARVTEAIEIFGAIDILVNNAGYVLSGVWEELSSDAVTQQFDTNLWGAIRMTNAVLPHLRAKGAGTVIFMSSIAAWLGAAAGGPYSAAKFALEGAVECLNKEISPLGIRTHIIVLGQFRTSILASGNKKVDRSRKCSDYDNIVEGVLRRHAGTDNKQPGDPVVAVARIVDAVRQEGPYSSISPLPLRIVLGSDAVAILRNECETTLRDLKLFETVSSTTDFPDAEVEPYK